MNKYYIYVASSVFYLSHAKIKIGYTGQPCGRLSSYLTGCPPDEDGKYDIAFYRLWETDAECEYESRRYESIVHNRFLRNRMMRRIPKDSEWFYFPDEDPLLAIDSFMDTQVWANSIKILNYISQQRFLKKQILTNTQFIPKSEKRLSILNSIQEPVVKLLKSFLLNHEQLAGTILAPCGSGKTVMPCKAIESLGLLRIIVCCPSEIIQKQWEDAMIRFGNFKKEDILFVGDLGTTSEDEIKLKMENLKFCIITTYMSSHLLIGLNLSEVQLFIGDEAHHQAGIVSFSNGSESGSGRTRRLLQKVLEEKLKRLFLTFTPRKVKHSDNRLLCFSMDDENVVFGKNIAKINLRDLIEKGVLPDYHIWALKEESFKNTGLKGKAQCLIEAWNATSMENNEEQYILNHLIVFTITIKDAIDLQNILTKNLEDTFIVRAQEGDLQTSIRKFSFSTRAIFIDCHRLSEGVDIPIADSVAILYPKQSREQITQMVLRPGRWCENKPLFHILIPIVDDEDLSGLQEVLIALAENDTCVRDELEKKFSVSGYSEKTTTHSPPSNNEPGRITIEEYGSDQARECFNLVRQKMFLSKDKKEQFAVLQRMNREMNITCRMHYEKNKEKHPFYIENPEEYFQAYWTNWYDFFGINTSKFPKTKEDWKKIVRDKGIISLKKYQSQIGDDLPMEPSLFYQNFFNFDTELGVEDIFI